MVAAIMATTSSASWPTAWAAGPSPAEAASSTSAGGLGQAAEGQVAAVGRLQHGRGVLQPEVGGDRGLEEGRRPAAVARPQRQTEAPHPEPGPPGVKSPESSPREGNRTVGRRGPGRRS